MQEKQKIKERKQRAGMVNRILGMAGPPSSHGSSTRFGSLHYSIARMAQVKGKLFGTGEEKDGGPSEEDNQEDDELSDQFWVHESLLYLRG